MHMNYRIQLPDHDWVVGEKHRLIPSVYGFINIKENLLEDHKAVTYSGPTFIAIRSGKSCSSTALSHARDFNFIMNCDEFADIVSWVMVNISRYWSWLWTVGRTRIPGKLPYIGKCVLKLTLVEKSSKASGLRFKKMCWIYTKLCCFKKTIICLLICQC